MRTGHLVADSVGLLVSVDDGFSTIMQSERRNLIGRAVLDITAPADRTECGKCIDRLMTHRVPFEITKRFIRDDGTLVWVKNIVSLLGGGRDGDQLVAAVVPVVEDEGARAPALLLENARLLAELQEHRSALFDPALLSSTGWSAMLAAYIAEAEGRAVTVAMLSRRLGISVRQADRWIAALIRADMIEIETRETDPYAAKSFLLTASAHRRLEGHLERAGERLEEARPRRVANR